MVVDSFYVDNPFVIISPSPCTGSLATQPAGRMNMRLRPKVIEGRASTELRRQLRESMVRLSPLAVRPLITHSSPKPPASSSSGLSGSQASAPHSWHAGRRHDDHDGGRG